jgi:hypothetical protein
MVPDERHVSGPGSPASDEPAGARPISSNEVTGFEWAFVGVAVPIDVWAWSAFFRR